MARRPLSRRATISMGAKGRSACFRSRGSKTIRIGCAIRLEVAIIVSGLIREKKKKKIFGRKRRTLRLGPWPAVLTLLRLLMTSVFRLIGRGRPWSFRKRPQALQRTEPSSSLRQRGVVDVPQFWQTGCSWGGFWSVTVVAIVKGSVKRTESSQNEEG